MESYSIFNLYCPSKPNNLLYNLVIKYEYIFQALVSINMFGLTDYKFDIIHTLVLMHYI